MVAPITLMEYVAKEAEGKAAVLKQVALLSLEGKVYTGPSPLCCPCLTLTGLGSL